MDLLQFLFLHFLVITVVYCASIPKQEGSKSTTCNHNGKDYKDGEEWDLQTVRDAFVLRCNIKPNGYMYEEVVACLMSDGSHLALDGTQKQDGQNVWTCTKNAKGAIKEWKLVGATSNSDSPSKKVSSSSKKASTTNSTSSDPITDSQPSWKGPKCGKRIPGTHWLEKSFEFECDAKGEAKLVACLPKTDKLHRVAVSNSPQKEGDYIIHCQQNPDGVTSLKWEWIGKPTKQTKQQ